MTDNAPMRYFYHRESDCYFALPADGVENALGSSDGGSCIEISLDEYLEQTQRYEGAQ